MKRYINGDIYECEHFFLFEGRTRGLLAEFSVKESVFKQQRIGGVIIQGHFCPDSGALKGRNIVIAPGCFAMAGNFKLNKPESLVRFDITKNKATRGVNNQTAQEFLLC